MRKLVNNILCFLVVGLLFSACGGGGDSPAPVPENKAPSIPSLVSPANNFFCIDNSVAFEWGTSVDPEGDEIRYQIDVSLNNNFSSIAHTFTVSNLNKVISLEKGIAYFWRVKATDNKSASSSYSSVYSFYTEGVGISNYAPFVPVLVSPSLDAVLQTDSSSSATLEWTATDVDNDSLTYDIYFDSNNPPTTMVADNISENKLIVNLVGATNYYWKVIVKDGKGGQTLGQVWTFKTD